jgi:hypothetical protein
MNMWGFTPSIFALLEAEFITYLRTKSHELKSENYIPLSVGNLVKGQQATCRILRTTAAWFGVTYREDKALVQASILEQVRQGNYPTSLWT